MKNKYVFVTAMLALILILGVVFTSTYVHTQEKNKEEQELLVVTSFYPMYVIADNVAGDLDGVRLESLSEPQTGCLHDYQMTAEDMKLLSTADVFVVNGGGIENFLSDVAESYPELTIINACDGLELSEGNAHAWMSLNLYIEQIEKVTEGLCEVDAGRAAWYRENAHDYLHMVEHLKNDYQGYLESLRGESVILLHEAFEYVCEQYGMHSAGLLNLDEERQVSAGEVAKLLEAIEEYNVKYVLADEHHGADLGAMLEKESDVHVIYLEPLTQGNYEKNSYLSDMEENIHRLLEMVGVSAEEIHIEDAHAHEGSDADHQEEE